MPQAESPRRAPTVSANRLHSPVGPSENVTAVEDGDAKALAERFAPLLVLYAEYHRDENKEADKDRDYHPRDIRLVLSMASSSQFNWEDSSKFGIPTRLARQWPIPLLFLWLLFTAGVSWVLGEILVGFSSAWFWFLRVPLIVGALLMGQVPGVVIAGASNRGKLALLALFGVLAGGFYGLVLAVDPEAPSSVTYVPVIPGLALVVVLSAEFFYFERKAKSGALLSKLKKRSRPELCLRYRGAGSPGDRRGHREAYKRALSDEARARYKPTVYAHVVRGGGSLAGCVAIQYWMAYFYNDWQNVHEMDWEQVTVYVRLNDGAAVSEADPKMCGFSVHDGGLVVPWDKEKRKPLYLYLGALLLGLRNDETGFRSEDDHPIVYVAQGSHANYPKPGEHLPSTRFGGLRFTVRELAMVRGKPLADYIDTTLPVGSGVPVMPIVVALPIDPGKKGNWRHSCTGHGEGDRVPCVRDFRWLNLEGKWGWPGGILAGDASPRTPTNQLAWDPFLWLEACEQPQVSEGRGLLLDAL